MKIFAIADLHLSGSPASKPMNVFGEHWLNHWEKIKSDWQKKVSNDDIVLIAGDISWAMNLSQAMEDLGEIMLLPGKKILVKGNHDYWWQGITKLNKAVDGKLFFIQNNFFQHENLAVCGSRGWICPDEPFFSQSDLTIYQRELLRVESSLKFARQAGCTEIILMLHFPPFSFPAVTGGFTSLISEYRVKTCLYGHLHKNKLSEDLPSTPTGLIGGVNYHLVSCDILNFSLKKIGYMELGELK